MEGRLETFGIEVADPAGAESLFCGSKTEVLDSNGDIDVGMILAVAATFPRLGMIGTADNDDGSFANPRTVIAGVEACLRISRLQHHELPRLEVDSRRSQAGTIEHVMEFFLFHRDICPIAANGMTFKH